jgi:mannose-6-phosphate isomerase-like protein (cupin superfamily)
MSTLTAFDLTSTYVHLEAGGDAEAEEVGEDFWARIGSRPYEGVRLVAAIRMTEDARAWEMHPAGDELLYLLSGAVDVVFRDDDHEQTVALRSGGACIVARGRWHRQIVREAGVMLFITPGAGTEHRPV